MPKALFRTVVRQSGDESSSELTLGQRFDPKRNSLTAMRLVLAAIVALVHASAIGWDNQPHVGSAQVGALAVDAFFVVSGFLVLRSAVRLPNLRRYAWHRFLRIMPGFWVCLIVMALVIAPALAWLQGLPLGVVFAGQESAWRFLANNSLLHMAQWDIAGTVTANDKALNGALWTLYYEALCYLMVLALVVLGLVARRGRPKPMLVRALRGHGVLVLTAVIWIWVTAQTAGWLTVGPQILPRFLLLFLLGALGFIYAHRIRFTGPLIVVAAVTWVLGMLALSDYRPLGAAGFAYLLLWAMVALPAGKEPPADLSYGIYVYHWPVQQMLAHAGLVAVGRVGFTLVALAASALLAFASWRLIEAPALAQKNAQWIDRLSFGSWRGAEAHATS